MGIKVYLKHIYAIRSLSSSRNCFPDAPVKIVTGTSWRKSSFSTYNGNCVEIGRLDSDIIGVRDTKHYGRGPVLAFTQDGWSAFLGGVKAGEFDPG
jgi:Domain of unknown function (DUF397)